MKDKIILGDCLNVMDLMKKESIDLCLTSPPYFNARPYSIWDTYEDYLSFMEQVFLKIHYSIKEGKFFVINTSPVITPRKSRSEKSTRHPIPFDLHHYITKAGFEFYEDIIWEKPSGSAFNRNGVFATTKKPLTYHPNCVTEYVMVYRKKTDKLLDWNLKQYDEEIIKASLVDGFHEQTNLWKIPPSRNKHHPATYPNGLAERIIKYYSMINDLVLDPFCGSGTTCIVAKYLKRKYIGIEINAEYHKKASENLTQSTIN